MRVFRWATICVGLTLFSCAEPEPPDDAVVVVAFDDTPAMSNTNQNDTTPPATSTNEMPPDEEPPVIVPEEEPNKGWIGGGCAAAGDCDYDASICMVADQPGGFCSSGCDGSCPNRDGANSATFCIDSGGMGRCVPECDTELYSFNGCRDGYRCERRGQYGDLTTTAAVCVPVGTPPDPEPEPEPVVPCLEQLDALGVNYRAWAYTTEYTDGLACTIVDPIYVQSPINGVQYRYFENSQPTEIAMGCELALSLYKLGEVFKEKNIVEVEHMGTFNCRKIGGTNSLSVHGLGLAIDFRGFTDSNGADYILVRDWEHDTTSPSTVKGRMLYELALRMYTENLFGYVLTPNFNSAHDDHIHVDMTPGVHGLGATVTAYDIGGDCGN